MVLGARNIDEIQYAQSPVFASTTGTGGSSAVSLFFARFFAGENRQMLVDGDIMISLFVSFFYRTC
jgi:hypothetical protein